MNELEPGSRRYTEKEVGLILRRATEMQAVEPTALDPAGLTLGELEEIATEAGIDPVLLRRAAHELRLIEPTTLGARLAGAPLAIQIERIIEGELPRERLEELVPVIQAATAGQGTASAVGRTLTWNSRTESNISPRQVLISAHDGVTVIRIEESFSGLSASLFGGIIGGVGGGVGFGLGGALSAILGLGTVLVAIPLTAIAGSYALARGIYSAQVRRREAAAHTLLDRLAEHVEAAIGESRAALPSPGPAALSSRTEGGDPRAV
jgi:hypothetical protein